MQNFKWKSSVTMIHHYISFNEIEKFSISALFFDLYEFYNSDFLFPGKIFNEIQWDGFITSSQEKYSIQSCRVSPSKWKSSTRCTLTGIFQWKLKVNGTTNLLQKWFWMKLKRKNQNFVKILFGKSSVNHNLLHNYIYCLLFRDIFLNFIEISSKNCRIIPTINSNQTAKFDRRVNVCNLITFCSSLYVVWSDLEHFGINRMSQNLFLWTNIECSHAAHLVRDFLHYDKEFGNVWNGFGSRIV